MTPLTNEVRERSRSAIMMPGRKIETRRATATTPKNYYEDTRYLIGTNIEPAQSDYHAPPRATTKGCKGR